MAETSSCAGEIQPALRGFDTSRFLKRPRPDLLFGNGNVDVETGVRLDSPVAFNLLGNA